MVHNRVDNASGHVVQARVIHGDVTFSSANNHDIRLAVRHHDREVALAVGERTSLDVTVRNASSQPRDVEFDLDGVPGLQWVITTRRGVAATSVSLAAGETVDLRLKVWCTPLRPTVGPAQLRVMATTDRKAWWRSDPKPVLVVASAEVEVSLDFAQVAKPGEYSGSLTLRNVGNTQVRVIPRRQTGRAEDGKNWLPADAVEFDSAAVVLTPDATATIDIRVTIPSWKPGVTTWHVPVEVDTGRPEVRTRGLPLRITQHDPAADLRRWVGTRRSVSQGALVLGAVIMLVAGIVLASGGSEPAELTFASSVPCGDAEKRVVALESLTKEEFDADGRVILDYDKRALRTPPSGQSTRWSSYQVQLSSRVALCDKGAAGEFQYFVWLGPVPIADIPALCADLGRVPGVSCNQL
ncbi:COG1470 family protein [Actinokineospora globicatena]|uniref:Uncharacterized protein n=1 Tax=Actinokineospora globicatena TaxID=103729 RepID=A0A9W6V5E7_9PSEU|nr:hypothetical protein [Actinokineospora globicatena]GLW90260.1 hypothetical protein Aglo03_10760 [Actinokineospora globicatena]